MHELRAVRLTLRVYPVLLGGCWVFAGCFLGVVGGVLNSRWGAGLYGIFVAGRRLRWPVVFGWWAQLDPFTASSGGSVGPKQVGWPLRWSLRGVSGCRVPEEASALAEGAPPCLCGPHKCPAVFLGVLLFLQAQVVSFLEPAAQGQLWVCAALQPLKFRPPWPPHLPSLGASLLGLGPGCFFPPPTTSGFLSNFPLV